MSDRPFERLVVPIAEPGDAESTCESIDPYLESTSELVVVNVIEQTEGAPDKAPREAMVARAEKIFETVRDRLDGHDLEIRTDLRYGSDVVAEILAAADDAEATAVAFTPRPGNRWVRLLTGDNATRLATESDLPVIVLPHPDEDSPEVADASGAAGGVHRVLVPVDGSDVAWNALEHACSVYPDSEVLVLHVRESSLGDEPASGAGDEAGSEDDPGVDGLFAEARAIADEYGVDLTTETRSGDVADAILAVSDESDVDAIVVARHGRSGLKRRLFGSTTESIVYRSSVPVTIVR